MAKCLHFWMVDVTGREDESGICGRKKWTGSYCSVFALVTQLQ